MIAWFTRNHVAANLLLLVIVLSGLYSLKNNIPIEVFPTVDLEIINVNVSLRGSTPEDTEQSVTIRAEEAIQDLEGIENITSSSSASTSSIRVEVDPRYNSRELLDDIKTRIDAINTFPAEAEKPITSLAIRKREVISVVVSGDLTEREIRQQADKVRDDLFALPSITQIEVTGVRDYEISIEVSSDKLRQYNLTLAQISQAIQNASLDLSGGVVKAQGGEILLRLKHQAYTQAEYENLIVASTNDGSAIKLRDVAKVTDGFVEDATLSRFNGKPSAMIDVYRVGNQSAIEVATTVKKYVTKQQALMPVGLSLDYWDDDSKVVKARLKTLITSALQGGILVLLVLSLFLRPAVAFWVFVGVPVSFMGSFLLMPILGVSLNIMSLFGFILVLGIVVDDAIVTGENIYRHLEMSENGEQAAILGTQEVATPVTFGVFTTVVAFIPMTMIEGFRGALFAQIAWVIIPILIFSLIESKFVLPAHLKHVKVKKTGDNKFSQWQRNFAKGFEDFILRYYRPALDFCLRNRYTTIAVFLGMLIVIFSLIATGWMRFVFFPSIQSETARFSLTMPAGTPFEVTDKHIKFITQQALVLQQRHIDPITGESIILNINSVSGSGNNYSGRVRFEISSPEERTLKITNKELTQEWRKLIGDIPGAEQLQFRSEIGHSGDPIDIQFSGNNYQQLNGIAELTKDYLRTVPGIFDIADSMPANSEEIRLQLRPEAYALGLTDNSVIRQVREAFFGMEVQRIQRGRDDIRVMVRFPRSERQSIANLKDLRISTANGDRIPIGQVVDLIPGKSPTKIYRTDLQRTLNVLADMDKETVNMTIVSAGLKEFIDNNIRNFPSVRYTMEGEQKEQSESMGSVITGLGFVFFAIYSLLAIPFKSYLQPLIVMSIIPFGTIGAIIGHWIMGMPLTFFSVLGMLALIGVVINDSLVLVDFINQRRKQSSVMEAITQAGVARFRPVLLTSLTTFFGLIPLLFEQSTQAQFLIPMAISLAFGILFATLITLILVPVNYLVAYELYQKIKRKG